MIDYGDALCNRRHDSTGGTLSRYWPLPGWRLEVKEKRCFDRWFAHPLISLEWPDPLDARLFGVLRRSARSSKDTWTLEQLEMDVLAEVNDERRRSWYMANDIAAHSKRQRGDIKPTASGQSEGNYNVFREDERRVIISRMTMSVGHAKFS